MEQERSSAETNEEIDLIKEELQRSAEELREAKEELRGVGDELEEERAAQRRRASLMALVAAGYSCIIVVVGIAFGTAAGEAIVWGAGRGAVIGVVGLIRKGIRPRDLIADQYS